MKKTLISVMALVLCLGLMGGAFAYFSDTETSSDNTFTAGTIDLSLPIDLGEGYTHLTDLKPCETGLLYLLVHNDGTNEMDIWKHLHNVVCAENGIIEPEQAWYDANPGVSPKNDIDTEMVYSIYALIYDEVPEAGMEVETRSIIVAEPPWEYPFTVRDFTCSWIYLGPLEPGQWMLVIQDYHLFPDVENWAQSDTMTFDIDFFAQQTTGGAPPPDPEMPGYGKPQP